MYLTTSNEHNKGQRHQGVKSVGKVKALSTAPKTDAHSSTPVLNQAYEETNKE